MKLVSKDTLHRMLSFTQCSNSIWFYQVLKMLYQISIVYIFFSYRILRYYFEVIIYIENLFNQVQRLVLHWYRQQEEWSSSDNDNNEYILWFNSTESCGLNDVERLNAERQHRMTDIKRLNVERTQHRKTVCRMAENRMTELQKKKCQKPLENDWM